MPPNTEIVMSNLYNFIHTETPVQGRAIHFGETLFGGNLCDDTLWLILQQRLRNNSKKQIYQAKVADCCPQDRPQFRLFSWITSEPGDQVRTRTLHASAERCISLDRNTHTLHFCPGIDHCEKALVNICGLMCRFEFPGYETTMPYRPGTIAGPWGNILSQIRYPYPL